MHATLSEQTAVAVKDAGAGARDVTVALAGNPNAGKTTLFNALTGLRQKVANYAGVTVERKEGSWRLPGGGQQVRLVDLPGLYSLDAFSIDEEIARDVLTGGIADLSKPDVIVVTVDATNLDRNLYLVTQLLEYRIPLVVALTMVDSATSAAINIDLEKMSRFLRVPVVPVVASERKGLTELAEAVSQVARKPLEASPFPFFEADGRSADGNGHGRILARYAWISEVVQESVVAEKARVENRSERIDRVLTHKIFGPLILVAILLFVFQSIFSWASLPMDLLDSTFASIGDLTKSAMPPGLLTDLLTDGVIAGVGGVLVFLPQIALLFLFISILEDTGYMARAAFILDRLMRSVGLHGKAFVPLLSSFACAIPGIMAMRTIENPKDRLATIMIAPFMSCSARLPVYTLMIGAFFSGQYLFGFLSVGALLILSMYTLGVVTAVIVALLLKRTVLKAPAPPLLMELPPYRMPNFKVVAVNVFQRAGMFVKRAGTIILTISIILWALANFPRLPETSNTSAPESSTSEVAQADDPGEALKREEAQAAGEQLSYSVAGRLGHAIEPVIRPLGYDWKIGIGLISSFAAREVFVSTMGILYSVGKDEDATSSSLLQAMRDAKRKDGTPVWTPLLALTTMIFYLLAFQCMSTFATVRRETNSWKWTLFMVGYMTVLAYVVTFLVYQGGRLLGF
ncbi:MAG: ferrous iron transporter FeoB [Acidobacteria bacterium OLB17]|nr:MAG: ferrous iron transporter FeoB [Acidobacteria bacterium OLB17]MCZ2391601.1 ferrous iron transport protein B [Acidobacteriota bacterium]